MFPPMGLMDQGWAAHGTSDGDAAHLSLNLIRLADDLGFDSYWLGEHHLKRVGAEFWGRFPAPEIVLGAAAALTQRIKLGVGVRVLSTTTSQRAAEEMRLLSVLSGGRVDIGLGLGTGPNGLTDRAAKIALFAKLVDELLGYLNDSDSISPDSPVDITKRLWVAARDEATVAHVASRGLNLVVGQAEGGWKQRPYVDNYRRDGGTGRVRGVRLVFIAGSQAEAEQQVQAAAELHFKQMSQATYLKEAIEKGQKSARPESLQELLDHLDYCVGTPERVAAQLNAYIQEAGVDQVDAMVNLPLLDQAHISRTLRLLQSEVRPQLVFPNTAAEKGVVAC